MLGGSKARCKKRSLCPMCNITRRTTTSFYQSKAKKKHLLSHLHPPFPFAPPPISFVPPPSFFVILPLVYSSAFPFAVPSFSLLFSSFFCPS